MAFENDPEGRALACRYAGHDFDQARIVTHEIFREYAPGEWSVANFLAYINDAAASIPEEHRAAAKVEMYDPGYDGPTSLRMTYEGPESPETVAERVRQCEKYAAQSRADERKAYERLKEKFG